MHATIFSRGAGGWSRDVLADGGMLVLPEIGIDLPMAELYEDLAFDPAWIGACIKIASISALMAGEGRPSTPLRPLGRRG